MTRIFKLNPEADAPTGGLSTDRLLLRTAGGARVDSAFARMGTVDPTVIAAFTDLIENNEEYIAVNPAFATRQTINGIVVSNWSSSPLGHILPSALANQPQFTQAALWKITNFDGQARRQIMHAISGSTLNRAALRQSSTGTIEGRCMRSGGTLSIVDLICENFDGWYAAAVVFDMTNNLMTVHDLLGSASSDDGIDGTSGAPHSDVDGYSLGRSASAAGDRFNGLLADAFHLPYAAGANDITALRLHMRARANKLAG